MCMRSLTTCTGTLFAGDLFTASGQPPASTNGDIVGPATAAEDTSRSSAITRTSGSTVRNMATWKPHTLALMHRPAFTGDTTGALDALEDDYDRRMTAQLDTSNRRSPLRTTPNGALSR